MPSRSLINFVPHLSTHARSHLLSLDDNLIGRSAFCRDVDALPVVGDLGGVDVEAVIRLQPDVLLYQSTVAPPPDGLAEAAVASRATLTCITVDDIDDLDLDDGFDHDINIVP